MTSCCATVVFLCSPVTTRGVDPAMSCRARAPAVTTNSNEFGSFERSIMKCPYNVFGFTTHASETGSLGDDDAPEPVDGRRNLVVDHDKIVLGVRRDFLTRNLQPPLNGVLAVLAAAAQPPLEHLERRRHH